MPVDAPRPVTVALLGTGIMGAPMARCALAAGLAVRVWSHPLGDAERLASDGATVCASARDAAAGATLVVTMVPDAAAAEEVATGPDGLLAALAVDAVWVQCATVGIPGTERLALLAAEADAAFVDAPVLGSSGPAAAGELVVLASGPPDALNRAEPFFAAIGRRTLRLGAAGAGSRMKLVTNNWIMCAVASVAESMALAGALDVDPAQFLEAIAGGALDMGYAQTKGRMMLADAYEPQMRLRHGAKDARLATEAARDAGLEHSVTAAVAEAMARGVALGHGEADMAAVFRVAAGRAPRGSA